MPHAYHSAAAGSVKATPPVPPSTLVAIAGIPGTGKTVLARALAARLGAATSLERFDPESNPFLARFYASKEHMSRYAFHVQLTFLTQKMAELRRIRATPGLTIQDQALNVDVEVFAAGHAERGYISPEEWALFCQVLEEYRAHPAVRPPELLIALTGPLPVVLERIARRGRPDEQKVEPEYWAGLHARFSRCVSRYAEGPILKLDIREYDLLADPAAIDGLVRRVETALQGQRLLAQVTRASEAPAPPGDGLRQS